MRQLEQPLHEEIKKACRKNPELIDKFSDEDFYKEFLQDLIKETGSLSKGLLKDLKKLLISRQKMKKGFLKRHYKLWRDSFDILEVIIALCAEAGKDYNTNWRKDLSAEDATIDDLVLDLLVRHQARACMIAEEILCLLKSGFADAALSRWRTLHEVSVTTLFIAKHGAECAERFYFHEYVEAYKGATMHKSYEDRIREKTPSEKEIAELKEEHDRIIDQYGKAFKKPYGWAAAFTNNDNTTLTHIEMDVELDHLRPYYKIASFRSHAGSKGIRAISGAEDLDEEVLLVGPSNYRISTPASLCSISLMQVTIALISQSPALDDIATMKLIETLNKELEEALIDNPIN